MAELIMMIGLPAVGKDTYIENFLKDKDNYVVISSDKIREEVFGDINDQTHNQEVFAIMKKRTVKALKEDKNVIYNATNLNRKKRIHFLKDLPPCERKAIVLVAPFRICNVRNLKRDRTVPYAAMRKMYYNFEPPYWTEGFDSIEVVQAYEKKELLPIDTLERMEKINEETLHNNSHHTFTCGQHCKMAEKSMIELIGEYYSDSYFYHQDLVAAARFHDIGKFKTKVFKDRNGNVTKEAHFFNHENVSAYDFISSFNPYNIIGIKSASTASAFLIEVSNLIANHMVFYNKDALAARRKIYNNEFWEKLELLHKADQLAH